MHTSDEGIIFFSTVATHILYETSHFWGENTNTIRADSFSYSIGLCSQPQKHYQLTATYMCRPQA